VQNASPFWFVGSAIQAGIFLAETFESTLFDLCQSFAGIGNLKLEISDPTPFREKIPAWIADLSRPKSKPGPQ
jgi:hypothetical protein